MESKRREDSHALMAMIFNSIPEGVHCVDAAGTIAAINAAARQMYGYTDSEIVGRTTDILLPAGRRDEVRRLLMLAFGGEIVPRFPIVRVRSDGVEIGVAMTIVPMRESDGAVSSVACITTSIGKAVRQASRPSRRHEPHARRLSLDLRSH
jgi:PAS domain S-box-containing protein